MRRADRLFQIIQYLQGRRLVTARQLAERLNVSERTVYRDIQDLTLSGVPIEGEAGVGYVLRHGYHLPPLMFNPDEMEALTVGVRLVRAWTGGSLARAAEEALIKIEHALPPKLKSRLAKPRLFAPEFHAYAQYQFRMDELRNAINARRKLALEYTREDGAASERVIRPLGLFFWGSVWTLAAWCELRVDYRSFRIDRIQKLTALDEHFEETDTISLAALFARYKTRAD